MNPYLKQRLLQFLALVLEGLRDEGSEPDETGECGCCYWQSGDHDPNCLWDQAQKLKTEVEAL